jgi:hypothetical protein
MTGQQDVFAAKVFTAASAKVSHLETNNTYGKVEF